MRGRLGRAGYPDLDGGIWVHAVSVGEVGVARSLLASLGRRVPGVRLGLSVTTRAGRELAERSAGEVPVFAFPLDLSGPVNRALDETRPGLILLTETELWPLFIQRAERRGIPVALVNGRLSDRSWRRYRIVGGWFGAVLRRISLFAMQTATDARRVEALGAPADRVRLTGNVKYDVRPPPPFADAERIRAAAAGRPIVVAASTGEGEEAQVEAAWRRLKVPALLAIAPRRPERFETVARELERSGHSVMRRSGRALQRPDVYLLDTIGELAALYREAAIAFLGGSLVPVGGHNPIEAWAAGCPVLAGPHTQNFREVVDAGERMGILRRVADAVALAAAIEEALRDTAATAAAGSRAEQFVAENRGAADATAEAVLPLLRPAAAAQRRSKERGA